MCQRNRTQVHVTPPSDSREDLVRTIQYILYVRINSYGHTEEGLSESSNQRQYAHKIHIARTTCTGSYGWIPLDCRKEVALQSYNTVPNLCTTVYNTVSVVTNSPGEI